MKSTSPSPCRPAEFFGIASALLVVAIFGSGCINKGDTCVNGCEVAAPQCGNGKVERGEECDDENRENGDGCSRNCQEVDPNYACPANGGECTVDDSLETSDAATDTTENGDVTTDDDDDSGSGGAQQAVGDNHDVNSTDADAASAQESVTDSPSSLPEGGNGGGSGGSSEMEGTSSGAGGEVPCTPNQPTAACSEGACGESAADGCGSWLDPNTSLTWQQSAPLVKVTFAEATEYCAALGLAGGNWRLPTISELRSLVRGCAKAETGGACGVTDECLSAQCSGTDCEICAIDGGPVGGCYWPTEVAGACTASSAGSGNFWSSSRFENDSNNVWTVAFDRASILSWPVTNLNYRRCVK